MIKDHIHESWLNTTFLCYLIMIGEVEPHRSWLDSTEMAFFNEVECKQDNYVDNNGP